LILFVLSIAVMNFGLGYALAVALSDAPLVPHDFLARMKAALFGEDDITTDDDISLLPASLADLPPEWLVQLSATGFVPESFVEGLVLKLWIDVTPQREQLLTAEVRGRLALSLVDRAAQSQLLADVRSLQEAWRDQVQLIQQLLQAKLSVLGDERPLGDSLDLLLDRQLKLQALGSEELVGIDLEREPEFDSRKLLASLTRSIDAAHALRDGLQQLLALKLRGASAPAELGQPLYLDSLTGQISRIGLEGLFETWWQEDPQRLRLASCALVKIDRFARLNERLGHRAGDRLLHAVAGLLANAVRADRGFDRLARYTGGTFLLFFGDTGPRNAALAIERMRQSFEALTFDYDNNELDVSISAGIVPLCREDDVDQLLDRARLALGDAQKHGRNRTSVDDGEGPQPLYEPHRYPVRAERIRIEAA
jgi:diguanylate cyclase